MEFRLFLESSNLEICGVLLRLRRIENLSIEESFGSEFRPPRRDAQLVHGSLVEIGAHHAGGHPEIIRRGGKHAPAAKLRQPPDRKFRLWIVTFATRERQTSQIL